MTQIDSLLKHPGARRQLRAIVDARRLLSAGLDHRHGSDLGRLRDDVGEVQLSLRVGGGELLQRLEEELRVGQVNAGVDLVDLQLERRGVFVLDDSLHLRALAQHPAVARGIFEHAAHQRERTRSGAVSVDQALERLAGDEGHVSIENQHRSAKFLQRALGAGDGVSGASLLGLQREGQGLVWKRLGEQPLHLIRLVPDDGDDIRGAHLERAGDRVAAHRLAQQRVEHLRPHTAPPPTERRNPWTSAVWHCAAAGVNPTA